jgi:dTDP-4-dehydrorhamnose 3,5-epimerase
MRFVATPVPGAFELELERHDDERGTFARTFCADEFASHGLDPHIAQTSLSWNKIRGTLRGLHFQRAPHAEAKTVRVVAGAIFDVVADIRPDSPTFGRWHGAELTAENGRALHIPAGCAHGFLTLADATVVHYEISARYESSASAGVRWDDPTLAIVWPFAPVRIGARDRDLPRLER